MMQKMIAALAALAWCGLGGESVAQDESFAGTWAFQTAPYGGDQFVVMMSGVAVMTPSAPGRYDIQLLSNERIMSRVNGRSQLLTARQTCSGESDGPQFTITCQLAEPLEGYQPDNFLLQTGEDGQLLGVLDSAAQSEVTFTRLR